MLQSFQKKLDPVLLACSLAGLILVSSFPFISDKPNRIVAGSLRNWWESNHDYSWLVPLSLVGLLICSLATWKHRVRLMGIFTAFGIFGIFQSIGSYASYVAASNSYARVSPASGAWLALAVLFSVILHIFSDQKNKLVEKSTAAIAVCLAVGIPIISGEMKHLSFALEWAQKQDRFMDEVWTHLALAFSSVAVSSLVGIPLGVMAVKLGRFENRIFSILNVVQTIPSIALFGLLITPLALLVTKVPILAEFGIQGIGWAPAFIALTLYGLLPIARNTYTGLKEMPPSILEAARGVGMTNRQIFFKVEVPITLPVILSGVRTACIQAIGNTTVAALIGAGGLGVFIFQGLGQSAEDLVLLGVLPVIFLAVTTDLLFQYLIRRPSPEVMND